MKRNFTLFISILVLIIAGFFSVRRLKTEPSSDTYETSDDTIYTRIISMSPSITETLFALDLGEKVVGVTRFCTYPPEAQKKMKVGGYIDLNYEAIAALQPDLVILLPEHEKVRNYLSELGIRYKTVHNRTVPEILATIITIGSVCRTEKRAKEMTADINKRMQNILEQTKNLSHPRILIVIGRTMGTGSLKEIYIAGKNTSYDELIAYAGGINAYDGPDIAYPVLSAEGLLHINPEIIIDLVPDLDKTGLNKTKVMKEWKSVPGIEAVKNNRVYLLSNDYVAIPGPRFILFLEDLARIIHPEIKIE